MILICVYIYNIYVCVCVRACVCVFVCMCVCARLYIYIYYIYIYLYRYIDITKHGLLKLKQSAKLDEQYNNDGIRSNFGIRLKVSCLRNNQVHIGLLI